MLKKISKSLIFMIATQTLGLAIANQAWAGPTPNEVYLKVINGRINRVLRDSVEAQTFLREDLAEASKVLDKASIEWTDAPMSIPLVTESKVFLSKSISLDVSSIVTVLFHIKRQIDVSTLPLPLLRINLFAKKFSPELLAEGRSCELSLYPFPREILAHQSQELLKKLLTLVHSRRYRYASDWATKVIWIERTFETDAECGGDNRNILQLKAVFMDINTKKTETLAYTKTTSCGLKEIDLEKSLLKLLKKIKSNLSVCNFAH